MRRLWIWGTICSVQLSFALHTGETHHFVHLRAENAAERSQIAQYIHIDRIIEEDVYATVNSFDLAALKTFQSDKILKTYPLDFGHGEGGPTF